VADRFALRWDAAPEEHLQRLPPLLPVAGASTGCAALGVDCLKRVGAQMVDVFVPDSGPEDNVNLRRVP
jgi:hypothetical protein